MCCLPLTVRAVADIGCGSGAGGVIVARAFPEAKVTIIDINDAALHMANINVDVSGLRNIEVRKSNLLNDVEGTFDLLIANPPYLLDATSRTYRHGGGALGEGLSLKIIDAAIARLAPSGTLLLYTGSAIHHGVDAFRAATFEKLKQTHFDFDYCELDPDVFGEELDAFPYDSVDRIAVVLLTATRRAINA
jgi:methylase of polypeptide subunit release factors